MFKSLCALHIIIGDVILSMFELLDVQNAVLSLQSEVQYIDYGNGEVVENAGIHELPGNLSSPRGHALKYVLYGLKPIYMDPGSVGFQQVCRIFKFVKIQCITNMYY